MTDEEFDLKIKQECKEFVLAWLKMIAVASLIFLAVVAYKVGASEADDIVRTGSIEAERLATAAQYCLTEPAIEKFGTASDCYNFYWKHIISSTDKEYF